jgi:hypothetical protein
MSRMLVSRMLVAVGLLVLALAAPLRSGPVDGTSWAKVQVPGGSGTISGGSASEPGTWSLSRTFAAGQRACVIAIGDHEPIVDVEIKVYDSKNELVVKRRGAEPAPDFVMVVWYPPRQENYRIVINSYGKIDNVVSVAIK